MCVEWMIDQSVQYVDKRVIDEVGVEGWVAIVH